MTQELQKDVDALKRVKEMRLDGTRLTAAKRAIAGIPEPVEEVEKETPVDLFPKAPKKNKK